MFGETIERAQFRERAQFFFRERNPPLEILERFKLAIVPRAFNFFAVFLTQSVHHAKTKPERVVVHNHAAPIGFHDTDRLDLHAVPLRVFDDRRRRVKTHRLIVEQTGVKLGRAMHFQIRAAISQNCKTDRVRFRKSVKRK